MNVEQPGRVKAGTTDLRPVPQSVLLILAEPNDGRISWIREACLRAGWKHRIVTSVDRMTWTASVLRPAAVLMLDGGWEWTALVVDSVCGATNAPVLILGALSTDRALMVLREGVDAIIPSGLSGEETLARVFAIIRRSSEVLAPTTRYLESGTLRLDLWQSLLEVDNDIVHLTTIEIKLLAYLMRNAGNTIEPLRIVEHVWQDYASAGDNALRIAVGRLRSKLGDDAKAPKYIGVARGRGYKFLPPVVESSTRLDLSQHATLRSSISTVSLLLQKDSVPAPASGSYIRSWWITSSRQDSPMPPRFIPSRRVAWF